MELADIKIGMAVEVNEIYRDYVHEKFIHGGGFGRVLHISTDCVRDAGTIRIQWVNRKITNIHSAYLTSSTEKRLFTATLRGHPETKPQ